MIGLCKDCKYWSRGECVDIDLETFNDRELEGSDRVLYYLVDVECGLFTGPEFGCVRFRKK